VGSARISPGVRLPAGGAARLSLVHPDKQANTTQTPLEEVSRGVSISARLPSVGLDGDHRRHAPAQRFEGLGVSQLDGDVVHHVAAIVLRL